MNKVLHINLGGQPFTIDEDAYTALMDYFKDLHHHFGPGATARQEIEKTEENIAKALKEIIKKRPIVSLGDVQDAVETVGFPEGFVTPETGGRGQAPWNGYRTGRKLLRDPEQKVMGGVAAGLAAYLGVDNPVWIRLIWACAALYGGIGIGIYILLWAILPEARTPEDYAAMSGKPIDWKGMGSYARDEFDAFSRKIADLK
jgi:phage shock protein PspC (stress-responsive transcriptional regulator)